MPEGPEIRRAADRLAAVLVGRVIEDVMFGLPALRERDSDLRGQRVVDIETRGKALLTHFEHGLTVYSHNQLYGRWYVVQRDRYPDTRRSLRFALHTGRHSALLYSASEIAILDRDDLLSHPFLARIGPDILDASLTWRDVARRLLDPQFAGRQVASLFLDQGFLAGIGNYLRSEILFDAGINPRVRPVDLARRQVNALARSTLAISQRAYQTGGLTNPPARVAMLKRAGLRRGHYRHAVFGRADADCYHCGETVLRESIGARRLYWCPLCQY